jgi:hypothetical protein
VVGVSKVLLPPEGCAWLFAVVALVLRARPGKP